MGHRPVLQVHADILLSDVLCVTVWVMDALIVTDSFGDGFAWFCIWFKT